MHGIDLRLTRSSWRSLPAPGGRLHLIGHPDTPELLVHAIAAGDQSAAVRIGGQWAAVYESGSTVSIVQDMVRSFPLFYSHAGRPTVTDDIAVARSASARPGVAREAAEEFLHLGFVTGNDTLFTGIYQTQLGERVDLDAETVRSASFGRVLRHDAPGIRDERTADARFSAALGAVLDRAAGWIGHRQIVLPLSGGLDSRLLAVELRERGLSNVLTFTYGVGETSEIAISREVASRLGLPWEFVQYSTDEIRQEWGSEAAAAFITDSYAGASLPHIQDWLAVLRLRQRGLLADDAVFLPGHTIVGAMHDDDILDVPGRVDAATIRAVLLGHHATLQPDRDALVANRRFQAKLDAFLTRIGYDGTAVSRLDAIENWNMLERQTKYINHSMRTYEHFGYAWALPMLDPEFYDVWDSFDLSLARDRTWYRRYVNQRYAAATGHELSTFEGFAAAHIGRSRRERIKAVLRAFGLLTYVERRIMADAVARHPMGFQAYIGSRSQAQLRRFIMRGGSPRGIYTEQFLNDTWNPHTGLFRDGSAPVG